MKKIILSVICVVLAVAMLACSGESSSTDEVSNSDTVDVTLAPPSETLATYEGIDISVFALRYFFVQAYRDFQQTHYTDISAYLDPTLPLQDQVPEADGYTDYQSWYDYFLSIAKRDLEYYIAFAAEAKKDGVSLTDEEKASVDANVDSIAATAKGYGLSFEEYMKDLEGMGEGVTPQIMKDTYYTLQLATKYLQTKYDSFEITDDDIKKEFEKNKNSYTVADYNVITITPKYDATSTEQQKQDAKNDALNKGDAFMSSVQSGTSFVDAYKIIYPDLEEKDYEKFEKGCTVTDAKYSEDPDEVISWIFSDGRVDGDVTKFVDSQGRVKIVQVIKAPHENDFPILNARYIYIDLSLGEYTESTAKKLAEDIINQVSKSENKDEEFITLVEKHSNDTVTNKKGGLAENIIPTNTSLPQNVVSWLFEDGRKLYDCGYQEYTNYGVVCGYFVTFVSSYGEPYYSYVIKSNLKTEMLSDYIKEKTENTEISYDSELTALIY